jgi:hypothetical protein
MCTKGNATLISLIGHWILNSPIITQETHFLGQFLSGKVALAVWGNWKFCFRMTGKGILGKLRWMVTLSRAIALNLGLTWNEGCLFCSCCLSSLPTVWRVQWLPFDPTSVCSVQNAHQLLHRPTEVWWPGITNSLKKCRLHMPVSTFLIFVPDFTLISWTNSWFLPDWNLNPKFMWSIARESLPLPYDLYQVLVWKLSLPPALLHLHPCLWLSLSDLIAEHSIWSTVMWRTSCVVYRTQRRSESKSSEHARKCPVPARPS